MKKKIILAAFSLLALPFSGTARAEEVASEASTLIREMLEQETASYSLQLAVGRGEAEAFVRIGLTRFAKIWSGDAEISLVSSNGTVRDAVAGQLAFLTEDSLYIDSGVILEALSDWDEELFVLSREEEELPEEPGWAKIDFPLLDAEDEVFLQALRKDYPRLLKELGEEEDEEAGTIYFSAGRLEALLEELGAIYASRWDIVSDRGASDDAISDRDSLVLMNLIGEWRNRNVSQEGLASEVFEQAWLSDRLRQATESGWAIEGSFSAGKDDVAGTYALEFLVTADPPYVPGDGEEDEEDEGSGQVYVQLTFVSEPVEEQEPPELPEAELSGEAAESFLSRLVEFGKEMLERSREITE